MSALPVISEELCNEIKGLVHKYLWKNGRSKIPYDVLIRPKDIGGLKLFDPKFKDWSLKIAWVFRMYEDPTIQFLAETNWKIKMGAEFWNANLHVDDVKHFMQGSIFWIQVVQAWCSIHYKMPENANEVRDQLIWCNSNISSGESRISRRGAVDFRGEYISKILYVEMKESGPVGGRAPGMPAP